MPTMTPPISDPRDAAEAADHRRRERLDAEEAHIHVDHGHGDSRMPARQATPALIAQIREKIVRTGMPM